MQRNPFAYKGPVSGSQFTSRSEELEQLGGYMASEENCVLLSHRKWGKTSVLMQAMMHAADKDKRIATACFSLENGITENAFYAGMANAVINALSTSQKEFLDLASAGFERLRPEIFYNTKGEGSISMGFDWEALESNREEVLQLPERLATLTKRKLLVCLDNFQEIAGITDPIKVLRLIRSVWQQQPRVSYYFSANAQHPFRAWVSEPSGPLYEFGPTLFLHPIPVEHWAEYITQQFSNTSKFIPYETAKRIAELSIHNASLVQKLAYELWESSERRSSDILLNKVLEKLFDSYDTEFRNFVHPLSRARLTYLRVLCEYPADKPTLAIMLKYGIITPSGLLRLSRYFEKQGITYSYKGRPHFSNPLLGLWLKERYWGIKDVI